MNFLMLRSNNSQPSVKESQVEANYVSKADNTLEGLIAEDPFPESTSSEPRCSESEEIGNENSMAADSSGKNNQVDGHIDVTEDNGFIVIPCSMTTLLLFITGIILFCKIVLGSWIVVAGLKERNIISMKHSYNHAELSLQRSVGAANTFELHIAILVTLDSSFRPSGSSFPFE